MTKIVIDYDSVALFDCDALYDEVPLASAPLSWYISVDLEIDGRPVSVGCMVGAREWQHDTVKASGAGVRPFCTAWWTDASDHQDVPAGKRDAVESALIAASWRLFCLAEDDAAGDDDDDASADQQLLEGAETC